MCRLYVGTYGKYAAGSIAGAWLDLEQYAGPEDFFNACAALHKNEQEPEFMFQDYEDLPAFLYEESANTHNIERIYEFIDLSDWEREIVSLYDDRVDDVQAVIDSYMGSYDSLAEYGEHIALECMEVPAQLESYLDYESIGRDYSSDYHTIQSNGQFHFFSY